MSGRPPSLAPQVQEGLEGRTDMAADDCSFSGTNESRKSSIGNFDKLGRRIGAVPLEGRIPRIVRQQRWSPLMVPLFSVAARDAAT